MIVTFFGHQDAPSTLQPLLEKIVRHFIEECCADVFYVGNHGNFDRYVITTLRKLKKEFAHIRYYIVLAYMPTKNRNANQEPKDETLFPEELVNVMPKFSILKRNEWMLQKSDAVIAYVERRFGGAAKFFEKAIRQRKTVINIVDFESEQKTTWT